MSKDKLPKDNLKDVLDEAEWSWLKSHSERGVVIIVSSTLDLLEVGNAVAEDASKQVQQWIQSGLLVKPNAEQIEAWNLVPSKRFMSLVVQPYVLIQEIAVH